MANLKSKSLNDLESWNTKELRKLRMTLKNRIESLKKEGKPKELSGSHPLYEMDLDQCNELLDNVVKIEKGK